MILRKEAAVCLFIFLLFALASGDCNDDKLPGSEQMDKPDVNFKDINVAEGVCVRVYVPKSATPEKKLPLVVYIHGGGFVMYSAFLNPYDKYVYLLVTTANVVAVSVDYRRAQNHPFPGAYDDAWAALTWIASHAGKPGPEEWLNTHADFSRVFLVGDSAGANIAHNMLMKDGLDLDVTGLGLIHPYFWGSKPIGSHEARDEKGREPGDRVVLQSGATPDDPRINPFVDRAKLAGLKCNKVLVLIAEKDLFRDRGECYYEALSQSGWKGKAELMESPGKDHTFHLQTPEDKEAQAMLQRVSSFVNS
ncbi:probable carboxylesterase 12 [Diospyros lotus]|uniref:probable carboxylesterase 12 n=1 Tax=Diospyros lotus TaxID=55363 RepID=UPI0022505B1E|nr:probable carboxylesterase 12 [Diospyros lotus]